MTPKEYRAEMRRITQELRDLAAECRRKGDLETEARALALVEALLTMSEEDIDVVLATYGQDQN